MADGQLGQLNEILKGLIRLTAPAAKKTKEVADKLDPRNVIGTLISQAGSALGKASVIPAEQDLEKALSGTRTEAAMKSTEELTPKEQLTKSTMDEVVKINKEDVRQARDSGMSLTEIIEKQEEMDSTPSKKEVSQEEGMSTLNKLLVSLGGGLAAAGGNPNLAPSLLNLVQSREEQKGTLTDLEKISLKHLNKIEQIREKARLEGVELDDEQVTAEAFKNEFGSLITSFENLGMTGPVRGRITLPGMPQITEFESAAEQFVFSAASYLTGQKARGLSDKDIEKLSKSFKFERNFTRSKFEGKVQNVLNQMNARLRATGKPTVPDAKTVLNNIKQGLDPFTGQGSSSQNQGIDISHIKAIKPIGQ